MVGMKPLAARVADRFLKEALYDPESWYYRYEPGLDLQTIIDRWQKQRPGKDRRGNPLPRQKMYNDSMPVYLSVRELWPFREYTWTRENSRSGFARVKSKTVMLDGPLKWDALKEDLRANGWDPKEPLHLEIGKEGGVKVGEGNHRLALAKELGMSKVPVEFHFKSRKVRKQPPAKAETIEIRQNALEEVVEERLKEVNQQTARSLKEQAEIEKMVDGLMELLGM